MMAAKVYGDGLLGKLFPALSGEDEEGAELRPGRIRTHGSRPRRRRLRRGGRNLQHLTWAAVCCPVIFCGGSG